jgi:hypothetical protein
MILQILRGIRSAYGVMMGVQYAEAFLNDEPLAFDLASFLHPKEG